MLRASFTCFATLLFSLFFSSFTIAEETLTPEKLDKLVEKEIPDISKAPVVNDEKFLTRVTLDLIGRQPTTKELDAYLKNKSPDKRAKVIDRLLASEEYGKHWANYWSDTISYRVPPPELTFLSYKNFKKWMAEKINKNEPWDNITRELLSATGKIKANPAVTFIGYHQGNSIKLASETSRIFLGVQIECAQCHDHKFDVWKREQFHSLAAFFARTQAKLGGAQDGSSTTIKDAGKGEHRMPDAKNPRKRGKTMTPVFLRGEKLKQGIGDLARRKALAKFFTQKDNPWFAKAYTNRMWGNLMRRGFFEPVDNMGEYQVPVLQSVHEALAKHFTATDFDMQDLFRLLANSKTYQLETPVGTQFVLDANPAIHNKLNGDAVYQSLVNAIGLPNITPPKQKKTSAVRFPVPPKSTRDIIAEKFGYDPSLCPEEISRTMGQAMLMMNNKQIQAQINADPKSGTLLSKLLQSEKDNEKLVSRIFRNVLARHPSEKELNIALSHIRTVNNRGVAFEDLVWALINTAEFTTRR